MKRNIILIILILLFIVSVSFSGLGFYYDKNNSDNDEDTATNNNVNEDNKDNKDNSIDNKKDEDKGNDYLLLVKEYDQDLKYDTNQKMIYYYDDDYTKNIILENGEFYNAPKSKKYFNEDDYIHYEADSKTYLTLDNNKKLYFEDDDTFYTVVYDKNDDYSYILVENSKKKTSYLYDPHTKKLVNTFDGYSVNAWWHRNLTGSIYSEKYLTLCEYSSKKCGVKNLIGDTIIDFNYSDILELNATGLFVAYAYLDDDNYLVYLVNDKNQILFEGKNSNVFNMSYDLKKYIVIENNGTLEVFYIDGTRIKIDNIQHYYDKCGEHDDSFLFEEDGNLFILSSCVSSENEEYNKIYTNRKTYIVSKNGLIKTLNDYVKYKDDNYYYSDWNDKIKIYDSNYNNVYNTQCPKSKNCLININNGILNTRIYDSGKFESETYYNFIKKETSNEFEYEYTPLNSTYGFTSYNNVLSLYKNQELIKTFDGRYIYIDNGYFIKDKSVYRLNIN